MKTASIIFIVLGVILDFNQGGPIFGFIGLIIGIWMIVTLSKDTKSVAAGVLGLFFTGLLGGVLYLCWNPSKKSE